MISNTIIIILALIGYFLSAIGFYGIVLKFSTHERINWKVFFASLFWSVLIMTCGIATLFEIINNHTVLSKDDD